MLSNLATERALLAGLCQHGQQAYLECVDLLRPEIFTDTKNSLLFSVLNRILSTGKTNVDIPSIYSEATALSYNKMICESKEDKEYLNALFNYSISSENVRDQAAILFRLHVARSLQESSQKIYKELSEVKGTEGLDYIIGIPEKKLSSVITNLSYEDDLPVIGSYIDDYLEYVESGESKNIGVPTQFPIFNNIVGGGLRPGVHLIGARLKVGKSTLAKEVALHVSRMNIPVLYIDTEMTYDEQLPRMFASLAQLPLRYVEEGSYKHNIIDLKKIRIAAEELKNLPLTHKNVSGKDISEISAYIKRWIHKTVGVDITGRTNPHMIVYDYFKLMNPGVLKDMKEYEALGYQIAAMHDLCKQYNTPVLSFVQLNRDGITKESTDVFSQSDRLGWNAISLSIYKRKTADEIAEDGHKNGNMKLIPLEGRFLKQLDEGDYINLYFDKDKSSIKELGTKFGSNKDFTINESEQISCE